MAKVIKMIKKNMNAKSSKSSKGSNSKSMLRSGKPNAPDLNSLKKNSSSQSNYAKAVSNQDHINLGTPLTYPYKNVGDKSKAFILWFDQVGADDSAIVGGKTANLGEMYQNLTSKGIRVPNGFAITSYAYQYIIEKANIQGQIRDALRGLNTKDIHDLAVKGAKAREIIRQAEFPEELRQAIFAAYKDLCGAYKMDAVDVAVRSSATAEDLPTASFAGQQETYLNIHGEEALITACKNCFASLFTNRAISYRVDKNFDHFKVYLSIAVQKMARSDLGASGVMFTVDTETGFRDAIIINGSYGLGENVVQGAVNPDEWYIYKRTLKDGCRPILSKKLGEKAIKMIYTLDGNKPVKNIPTPKEDREKFVLSDDEVLTLATWGALIEDHYCKRNNRWMPMDIEWAKDGQDGKIYIVQARGETVQSQKDVSVLEEYVLKGKGEILATGAPVGNKIGSGRAMIIKDVKDISHFQSGCVLVTEMTDPDWEPVMKMASAIVTDRGGRTCHAAIVSRELGIPCVVGTNTGSQKIKDGKMVTVCCAEGETGHVYDGKLEYSIEKTDLKNLSQPKTKVMVNLGDPDQAMRLSFLPVAGVGLAREEFVINSYIKIHPKALIKYPKLADKAAVTEIDRLTQGFKDKTQFYVEKLSQGLGTICAAFYPREVIVRLADFKSNEYANLIGGKEFEPVEDNPMIGWRGAARYYSEDYKDCFALECQALKRVRDVMGLKNLTILIPMCRTVEEGKRVLAEMEKNGLKRGPDLKVLVMCEVPANVICAEEFCDIFDGFSIGSNDLTQFTLAVDRDSSLVSHLFNERNDAVKRLVKQVITVAKARGKKIGICGDAPSTYPEFAEYLVSCGIDSISLSPDAVMRTMKRIVEFEQKMGKAGK